MWDFMGGNEDKRGISKPHPLRFHPSTRCIFTTSCLQVADIDQARAIRTEQLMQLSPLLLAHREGGGWFLRREAPLGGASLPAGSLRERGPGRGTVTGTGRSHPSLPAPTEPPPAVSLSDAPARLRRF